MARFIARICPMCSYPMGVYIADPKIGRATYHPIYARCAGCGYKIAWVLITPSTKVAELRDG